MSERFQKMRANNQPEPEPEPEPAEDESLADVRAENAMAAMEIKRLRAELEQLHSAGGPGALLSPAEQVSLDEAAEKLGNREARLDLRLQEISREKDAADNVRLTPLKNGGDHSFGRRFGPLRHRPPVFWCHFLDS